MDVFGKENKMNKYRKSLYLRANFLLNKKLLGLGYFRLHKDNYLLQDYGRQ